MIYVTHDQVEAMTLGDVIVVMEAGRIRQANPPHQTYLRPADPFVAGFIGTPPMNLWSGRLERQAGEWHFRRGDLVVPIPALQASASLEKETEAVLGLRPEDIRIEAMPGIRDAAGDVAPLREIYLQPNVTDDYAIEFRDPDPDGIVRFLCDERAFSRARVTDALARAFPPPGLF